MPNPLSVDVVAAAKAQASEYNNLRSDALKGYPYLYNKSGGSLAEGDVVIWDPSNASSVTVTAVARSGRAAGVIMTGGADNAQVWLAPFGAQVTVNVQGNVAIGQALVTSTTSKRAMAGGGSTTRGLIGYALTAYSGGGAGTVTAIICPRFDTFGAQVLVEGASWIGQNVAAGSASASGTLACGSNADRYVVGFELVANYTARTSDPQPTVGGSNMTGLGAGWTSGWSGNGGYGAFRAWVFLAPATGSVSIATGTFTGSDGTRTGIGMLFVALSGVNQSSPIRTIQIATAGTTTPSASCTDAVVGDGVISFVGDIQQVGDTPALITGRGAGQVNAGSGYNSGGGRCDTMGVSDIESAASQTEQSSWTSSASRNFVSVVLPVVSL